MELTLTGGSTLSDNDSQSTPLHANGRSHANGGRAAVHAHQGGSLSQSHTHNHGHGHNHSNGPQGQCCNSHAAARPPVKIDASTLLPSKEQAQRFRSDKNFRLNMLSNVVRGGPYALFVDLLTVLVSDGEKKKDHEEVYSEGKAAADDAALKEADPVELAQKLDGYGSDGHTLAHWCAKRGEDVM